MTHVVALLLTLVIAVGAFLCLSLIDTDAATARTPQAQTSARKINLKVTGFLAWINARQTCQYVAGFYKVRRGQIGLCRLSTAQVSSCRIRYPWVSQAVCWATFRVDVPVAGFWLDCQHKTYWRKFRLIPLPAQVKKPYTFCRKVPSGRQPPT